MKIKVCSEYAVWQSTILYKALFKASAWRYPIPTTHSRGPRSPTPREQWAPPPPT